MYELVSHNKDSGFCSKLARKPTEGFETWVENIWLGFWKDNSGYNVY